MKTILVLSIFALTSVRALAGQDLRCTAAEESLGLQYVTQIKWIEANFAKVSLSLLGEGRELFVCQDLNPFGISQKDKIIEFSGELSCEGGKIKQAATLIFDQSSMTLNDGVRQLKCANIESLN